MHDDFLIFGVYCSRDGFACGIILRKCCTFRVHSIDMRKQYLTFQRKFFQLNGWPRRMEESSDDAIAAALNGPKSDEEVDLTPDKIPPKQSTSFLAKIKDCFSCCFASTIEIPTDFLTTPVIVRPLARKMPLLEPPEQESPEAHRTCMGCATEFTLIRRKNQCRACGGIFCEMCARHTTDLPQYGMPEDGPSCTPCYEREKRRWHFYEKQLPILESGERMGMVPPKSVTSMFNRGELKQRTLKYDDEKGALVWYGVRPNKIGAFNLKGEIAVEDIKGVIKPQGSGQNDYLVFTVMGPDQKSFEFVAEVQAMRDRWVVSLINLMEFYPSMKYYKDKLEAERRGEKLRVHIKSKRDRAKVTNHLKNKISEDSEKDSELQSHLNHISDLLRIDLDFSAFLSLI
eukprot:g8476.t1